MLKKYLPWGLNAEEKPRSKEDCRQIVHSMAKLKMCVKGLAKRDNQLKAVAATMYAIMKKKSADFRAQTGNRWFMRSLEGADWNKIVVNGEKFTILRRGGDQAGLRYRCPICKVEKDLHYKMSGITDDEGRRRLLAWAANCVPNHKYTGGRILGNFA